MKTYVEVACTTYKTILVEVEHERTTDDEVILNLARDAAQETTDADDMEICGWFSTKPEGVNLAMYDEFVETYE